MDDPVQAKKQLGPTRVKDIVEDAVARGDPPYGYILAAPATFSKKAYDAFRTALSERGVREFHLFGRAELEDMLYMPTNDRILFAFFGVSLSSKKRTRVSEVRITVNNKNKLYTILGATGAYEGEIDRHVLLRDLNDTHYPDKEQYVNREKKEWDFLPAIDLLYRESDRQQVGDEPARNIQVNFRERAHSFWEHLPISAQAKFLVDGLVLYQNFALIDKQGDPAFNFPHLYVDFGKNGPFDANWAYLQISRDEWEPIDGYKRVQIFPDEFPERKFGKVHTDHSLRLDPHKLTALKRDGWSLLLDPDDTYAFLKPTDVIPVADSEQKGYRLHAEVTHRYRVKFEDMDENHPLHWEVQQHFKQVQTDQVISVIELVRVYDHQFAAK